MPSYSHRMMFALSLGFAGILLILTTTSAYSNPANCAKRTILVQKLNERYGETQQSTGLTPGGHVFETFAHPETGTWTLLITLPEGISCMVASGKAYQNIRQPAGQGV